MLRGDLSGVFKEAQLNLFFRSEVGKETAFGHAGPFCERPESDAGETGSAEQIGSRLDDPGAGW